MYKIRFWAIATKKTFALAASLILSIAIFTWSLPAQAAPKIDPQLEEQVLAIIRKHPEAILESVQAYQQQQQQQVQQAQQTFVQQLKTAPQTIIGDSPVTGAQGRKIVLVEFSDFQCPYCSEAHKTLKAFMAKHQDQVTLVYKHFPLSQIHPEALPAAKAAWAANQQGKFWQYQDALFTNQDQLGEDFYLATAKNLNLNLEKFNRDRTSANANNAIQKDMQLAQTLGLSGTPFFVMNGETFAGAISLAEMEKILARVSQSTN